MITNQHIPTDVIKMINAKTKAERVEIMMVAWSECIVPHIYQCRDNEKASSFSNCFYTRVGDLTVTSSKPGFTVASLTFTLTAVKRCCKRLAKEVSYGNEPLTQLYGNASFYYQAKRLDT